MSAVANVLDYGADRTGVADSTTAIQTAINTGLATYIPGGTYEVTGLTVASSQAVIFGDSEYKSILRNTTATTPTITLNSGLANIVLRKLRLTRSVAATQGGHGLSALGSYSNCRIDSIVSDGNWLGFALGSTDYSPVNNCWANQNYSHGFYLSNVAGTTTPCQWYLTGNLSTQNDGSGLLLISAGGATGSISCGDIIGFRSFANSGYGAAFLGSSALPIQGVRLRDCFLGQDGSSEIVLDTYGGMHSVTNTFLELAGQSPTGRTLTTPASNQGFGLYATPNNQEVTLVGAVIDGNSVSGIGASNSSMSISGGRIGNNGRAQQPGNQAGVLQIASTTRIIINGVRLGQDGASTTQQYGMSATDGRSVSVVGCDLTGNASGYCTAASYLSAMTIIGCLPNDTLTNQVPGTIAKNGTPYLNP